MQDLKLQVTLTGTACMPASMPTPPGATLPGASAAFSPPIKLPLTLRRTLELFSQLLFVFLTPQNVSLNLLDNYRKYSLKTCILLQPILIVYCYINNHTHSAFLELFLRRISFRGISVKVGAPSTPAPKAVTAEYTWG